MASAASIARQLGGYRQGGDWRCPCPLCEYTLSLCNSEDGKFLAYCVGKHEYDDILTALVPYGLLDGDDFDVDVSSRAVKRNRSDERWRIATAKGTYELLAPATGTIVERPYLREVRGITIGIPEVLRYGLCRHRLGGRYPAMVAPVVNIDNDFIAYHATYLRFDGPAKALPASGHPSMGRC